MIIEEWTPDHPHWPALRAAVEALEQSDWLDFRAEWHRSSHVVVAHEEGTVIGFLRYVTQEIGPDADCPPVLLNGVPLVEAKVIAFGVDPARQGEGVGRALQREMLSAARSQAAIRCGHTAVETTLPTIT